MLDMNNLGSNIICGIIANIICETGKRICVPSKIKNFTIDKEEMFCYISEQMGEGFTRLNLSNSFMDYLDSPWTDVNKVDRKKCERIKNLS